MKDRIKSPKLYSRENNPLNDPDAMARLLAYATYIRKINKPEVNQPLRLKIENRLRDYDLDLYGSLSKTTLKKDRELFDYVRYITRLED